MSCVVTSFMAPASATAATGLAQVAGQRGCYVDVDREATSARGCTKVKALDGVVSAALSPDGTSLYAAVLGPVSSPRDEPVAPASGVTTFRRNPETGALTWDSCVTNNGTRGPDGTFGDCADGDGLRAISGVALTPDGRTLISTSGFHGSLNFTVPNSSVGVFGRDAQSGALTQTGCFSGWRCAFAPVLLWPSDVVASPDGRDAYVTAYKDDAVMHFGVTTSGGLAQRECISDDGSDGACAKGHALRGPERLVISADGRSVYVLGGAAGSIAVMRRDPATGVLSQASCLLSGERPGGCGPGAGVGSLFDLALSPSGESLYVLGSNGLRVFRRDPESGALARAGCLTTADGDEEDPAKGCEPVADFSPGGGAFAAAGDRVYVFSPGVSWYPDDESDDESDEESTEGYTVDTLWTFKRGSDGALTPEGCLASAPEDSDERYTGKCAGGLEVGSVTRMVAGGGPLYLLGDRITVFDSGAALTARVLPVRSGLASVRLACRRTAARACSGTVRVRVTGRGRRPGHISAARRFRLGSGRSTTLAVAAPLGGMAGRGGTVVLRQAGLRAVQTPVTLHRAAARGGT